MKREKCKYCNDIVPKGHYNTWVHDACVYQFSLRRLWQECVICGKKDGTRDTGYLFCEDHDEHSTYMGYDKKYKLYYEQKY